MQEQVNEKTMSLIVRGSKFTGRLLAKAIQKLLADMERQKRTGQQSKSFQGKQSVKEIVGQDADISNIEVADEGVKRFERIARKHGVDFELKKDASVDPPKWIVFFKAKDANAMTNAFNEYTSLTMKKTSDKPSLLASLRKNVERVKNQVVDRVRNKNKGIER